MSQVMDVTKTTHTDVTKSKQAVVENKPKRRIGRPPKGPEEAWNVDLLLKQSAEKQGELSVEAWRELDVMLRKHLRTALRKQGADQLSERGIKDLTVAASTCNIRAYPESSGNQLGAHVPAKLLSVVSERILKSRPVPIDVTPEPQSHTTTGSDGAQNVERIDVQHA